MSRTIAVLRGSPRADSNTARLARAIEAAAGDRLTFRDVTIVDLPLYNPDLDKDGRPEGWTRLREELRAADGVMFVSPEWNRSVPGGLKNALDIGSRPFGKGVWAGKPTAVVTQSTGGIGGFGCNHHLRQSLVHLDAHVLAQPEMYVGGITAEKFGTDGAASDPDLVKLLSTFASKFAAWVERFA